MASAHSLMIEENFCCSICLDVFMKPVTIPCGHNFCLDCITKHWDSCKLSCPVCQEKYLDRPKLRVNSFIAEMTLNFKKTAQEKLCLQPALGGNGNVFCDYCTETKSTAVKSCLMCVTSYCKAHLEPHQRNPVLKKHKLISPVKNLESRMCVTHYEYLEFFCKEDKVFVCKSCTDGDHKRHKIVTLEEEAQAVNAQLEKEKKNHMIQERLEKIHELQQSMELCRNNAVQATSYNMHVMTAVMDLIERSQAQLDEVIQIKLKNTEAELKGFIEELEQEIKQIKQNNSHLNQLQLGTDAFIFLEKFLSFKITQLHLKDWDGLTPNREKFNMLDALHELETTVTREIRQLCDPDFKEMLQYAVDLHLDPDTAHVSLNLSEDRKQVTHSDNKNMLPNSPQRFDHVLNVLAKESFSSGKFYYAVQVKNKTSWDLGVANKSINRKGDMRLSPKNGYWTICLRKGIELIANSSPAVKLHVREVPQKVGVFTDYEDGSISFYDVDNRAQLVTFTGCNFTEELFPFFSPGSNSDGKNSAPVILSSVKYDN